VPAALSATQCHCSGSFQHSGLIWALATPATEHERTAACVLAESTAYSTSWTPACFKSAIYYLAPSLHRLWLPVCCLSACRWALLYTLPDSAKGDVKRSPLNTALAAAYDFFYK
jgi:hypothetical protein